MAEKTIIVSAEALKRVSTLIDNATGTLDAALTIWKASNIDKPTGTDELSKALAKCYTVQENTSETLNSMIDGLSSLSFDYNKMALNYESTEQTNSS
jgi:hypothetical protein